ncbi:ABC transporter ATP-binding protein [Mesomycoplasma dispar]|uniref:ABC transporter ATP-binding protein n=1 Tax=Mesomycoplasma dispar TaxID=86660 RepID=A0ABM6PRW6_9BACT|nr:ABC transporter ATP-binding protein [Mesomycoplasma dispar]ATP59848.1 ABC transporter ATP-binding protein [Mesomycoplasma dispar]
MEKNQKLFQLKDLNLDLKQLDLNKLVASIGESQSETNGAKIELNNVSKKYEGNDKYTLESINLVIESGNFCIFLGPSGSGKTTLLRMIAGLNSITQGDLIFNGKRYNNLSPHQRNIAMVFQSYALYPHLNVYDNISFGLKIAKERKDVIDAKVKNVAKILKISDYLYSKPRDLSGGQRQRVAIGRAIARSPQVFLMDEPLSNLDAKLRESMRREIVNIHRMLKTTSIYVTHDQLEAMTMGNQIVVFNDGKIQQNGTGRQLYFKPQNTFVATFIGSPTMNLFDCIFHNNQIVATKAPISFEIDAKLAGLLSEDQNLKVGFRSEDIYINKKDAQFDGVITNVELIGKDQLVAIKVSDSLELTSNQNNIFEYFLDEKVKISFNLARIHIFDAKTKERIDFDN